MLRKSLRKEILKEFNASSPKPLTSARRVYETPKLDSKSQSLVLDRYGTPAPIEHFFRRRLLHALKEIGFIGDVATQEVLPIKLDKKLRSLLEANGHNTNGARYVIRRPDFLIPRCQIVIEIDGGVHDDRDYRIHRDNTREAEYVSAGLLPPYVIKNYQLNDVRACNRVISDIQQLVSQRLADPNCNRDYQTFRTAISRARKEINSTDSDHSIIGSYAKTDAQTIQWPDLEFKGVKQWRGYRWRVA